MDKEYKEAIEREKVICESLYGVGNAWTTEELTKEFEVLGFMAPFCVVKRRSDGVKGSVEFIHRPRVYFNFKKD